MPNETRRSDRVAEAIREEVATFIAEDMKDPRVRGLVTVTGADVTRDLRHARVFVTILGTEEEQRGTFEVLEHAAGHVRSRVGKALRLRVAPEIAFRHDTSVAYAARIDQLLEQVKQSPGEPT